MKFLIEQHIDLAQENAPMVYAQPLIGGDSDAHEWRVTVTKRGEKADIPTGSVMAYVRRDIVCEDWEEEPALKVTGSASGNVISVVLPSDVYTMGCPLVAVVRVAEADGRIVSLAVLRATSEKLIPGAVYDPDGEINNLDALLAQIENAKAAAAAANEAAQKASAAAEHAPYVEAATGLWLCWDAGAGKYVSSGVPATGPKGEDGDDGLTPYIGGNGNWWIGENDTGTKAQGPAGQNGTGSGTVTGVKLNRQTYQPDSAGVVELPEMGSSDVEIDDDTPSAEKVYSSQKTQEELNSLSQQITEQKESISDSWTSEKTYAARDYVIYGNRLFKCKIAHTAGNTFDATYWEAVSLSEELNAVDKKMFVVEKQSGSEGKVSINIKTTIGKRVLLFFGSANNFPCMGVVIANYEYEPAAYAMLRQFNFLEGEDEFRILECSTDGNVVTINMPLYGTYNFMAMFDIE